MDLAGNICEISSVKVKEVGGSNRKHNRQTKQEKSEIVDFKEFQIRREHLKKKDEELSQSCKWSTLKKYFFLVIKRELVIIVIIRNIL